MNGELIAMIPDNDTRKNLGLRIRDLRKQRKWTQKALANKLDLQFPQLNKYECGLHSPPIEKLVELAEIFDTTVDYLLTGNRTDERPLHNVRLLERFRELEEFSTEDQEAIIRILDAMIIKGKVEGAMKPFAKKAS
jgi:transcriptional regulator with XRE-family HTH domain